MSKQNDVLTEEQIESVQASINKRAHELKESYMSVLIQAVPVLQCADALKKSIDEIVDSIKLDQFEQAADLGYQDLCSNFVWIQRTLGAVHDAAMQCSAAIAEVAGDTGLSHEQVKPLVVEFFKKACGPNW
jgi:hypothetical protein